MPRLALLEPPFDDRAGALLARMMPGDAPPIGLFRLFARNPPMADAMHGWGRYELGRQLTLSMREREIAIGRTCALCGCEYEWGVHVMTFAERVGLTRGQTASLVYGGPADACWTSERERLLILAVDALHEHSDIDDALWTRLASVFDELPLLDLLLLCGWYHAVSFAARAARVPLEPGAPRFADFRPAGPGRVRASLHGRTAPAEHRRCP